MNILGLALVGLLAGTLSGITGLGGGVIIVPALIYFFGYSAHLAQGTTLAILVPPIGILAAWTYYQKGFVNLQAAIIIALAFVVGGYAGSKIALDIPEALMRKIFAGFLLVVALKMFFDNPTKISG